MELEPFLAQVPGVLSGVLPSGRYTLDRLDTSVHVDDPEEREGTSIIVDSKIYEQI